MDNELKEPLTEEALKTILKAELSPVIERLDRLELEQSQIKQAVLETNEIVKRLEVVQENQHRIIELLSARSIEQEAKLKKIG
ncbi:hypothetical protein [Paenibacillus roseipurpureus]|uniref:Uncharacterized protein n=1 Tax=Paenibacillus roseopurpureus TaxID=2918901 RepID=A0AA96LQC9_9BACL|nr:hypothetical protein [Paenibacillus sp. MBLB1832]WNR44681.1 hypothetical protein MJB10_00500 [Paenibacillus sp. MBLB1832]